MRDGGHSTIGAPGWDSAFGERSPMFEPLRAEAERLRGAHWPSLTDLQAMAARPPVLQVGSGAPLWFVPPDGACALGHERRAYERGEVQVRTSNWHDFFNALVWRTFPRSKAALNRAHYEAFGTARRVGRGARRDALTIFDESGVIVAASDESLLDALREFRWHELFWVQRARVRSAMRFALFGHALYEKALRPYVGLTGHALLLRVDPAHLSLPIEVQMSALDDAVGTRISDAASLSCVQALSPLPLLGVPGWWDDNNRESFYANTDYFRPRRTVRTRQAGAAIHAGRGQ